MLNFGLVCFDGGVCDMAFGICRSGDLINPKATPSRTSRRRPLPTKGSSRKGGADLSTSFPSFVTWTLIILPIVPLVFAGL